MSLPEEEDAPISNFTLKLRNRQYSEPFRSHDDDDDDDDDDVGRMCINVTGIQRAVYF